jgi:prepilin-type N-terminal cleavage/methylation domain-containing protein
MQHTWDDQNGFTLLELLVVAVVIIIFAVILLFVARPS